MNHRLPTIFFSGGGTLGSVTPLIAVADELHRRYPDWRLIFVGTIDGPEKALIMAGGYEFIAMPGAKLRRYWSGQNLRDVGGFIKALIRARQLIIDYHPRLIISAGSFISVPLAWMGKIFSVPIIIHQEDAQPGLANKLMAPVATNITVTLPNGLKEFSSAKTILTGNPIRSVIIHADPAKGRTLFNLPAGQPVLLIIGGGTGAAFLNELVARNKESLLTRYAVIHLSGPLRGLTDVDDHNYHRRQFIGAELANVIAASDVVVTRAGIGTLTELAALKKAAVVIPMPDTHQENNAAALAINSAAIVLNQRALTDQSFLTAVDDLADNEPRRRDLGARLSVWNKPGAANALADLVTKIIRP
jgi:UDP-N-acetylglucosamine--N-acetylmuramyl-(pentapeptide) pyrophosphoryl-undecaprenol N-acetylglucosamine transferase